MKPMHRRLLEEFAAKVRTRYPEARVRAFGSCARGTATKGSDLDICVVLHRMQPEDRLTISDIAWEVGFAHDLLLSTVVFSAEEFENGPVSAGPLLDSIRSEGVAA